MTPSWLFTVFTPSEAQRMWLHIYRSDVTVVYIWTSNSLLECKYTDVYLNRFQLSFALMLWFCPKNTNWCKLMAQTECFSHMLISTDLNRHPASLHGGCLRRHDTAPWVILQITLNGATTRLHIWTGMMCVCVCVCVCVCGRERESETGRWGEQHAGCSLWLQPHHRHPQMNRWKQMLPSAFPACHFPLPLQHVCSLEQRVWVRNTF